MLLLDRKFVLIGLAMFGLAACGQSDDAATPSTPSPSPEEVSTPSLGEDTIDEATAIVEDAIDTVGEVADEVLEDAGEVAQDVKDQAADEAEELKKKLEKEAEELAEDAEEEVADALKKLGS